MAKRSEHKSQHWVPRSYLAAWNDPEIPPGYEPYINLISKDGTECKRKSPYKTFCENDMYTVRRADGSRSLVLEHGLSQLEDAFARIRREYLDHWRIPPEICRIKLLVFLAAMKARSRRMRDYNKQFWGELLARGEEMEKEMRAKPPGYVPFPQMPSRGPSMNLDQVRELATNTMPRMLGPMITAELPFLEKMSAYILTTHEDIGFITSDTPVAWFDPDSQKKPAMWRNPSFSDPKLEITLPLSPRQCLVLARGPYSLVYKEVQPGTVREINRRTLFYAEEYGVVRRAYFEPYWKQN